MEDAIVVLNREDVKCFSCKHYTSTKDLGDLAYTFPCVGTSIATHGPLPVAHLCNGEPSSPNYPLFTIPNPENILEKFPDVVECRNYEKK